MNSKPSDPVKIAASLGKAKWRNDKNVDVQIQNVVEEYRTNQDFPVGELVVNNNFSSKTLDNYRDQIKDIGQNIKNKKCEEKFLFAYKNPDHLAFIIKQNEVTKEEFDKIKSSEILRFTYGPYLLFTLSAILPKQLAKWIELFEKYDQFVLSDQDSPFLINKKTKRAITSPRIIYSDTTGNGLIIKTMESGKYQSTIETEIEVHRLAKLMHVNVPDDSVLIKEDTYFSEIIPSPFLIQSLKAGSKPLLNVLGMTQDTQNRIKKLIAKTDPESLGRQIIFDTVAGAWDRHAGNYLVTEIDPKEKLPTKLFEIDFNLFLTTGQLRRSEKTGKQQSRHPFVTEIIKIAPQDKIISGMYQALQYLSKIGPTAMKTMVSDPYIVTRAEEILKPNTPTRNDFLKDIEENLGINRKKIFQLVDDTIPF
ncbi:MAG: hypothetical protein ACW967_02520 [Candidatus Hodarchaeales archaeon]|jgi:hypothetical protein